MNRVLFKMLSTAACIALIIPCAVVADDVCPNPFAKTIVLRLDGSDARLEDEPILAVEREPHPEDEQILLLEKKEYRGEIFWTKVVDDPVQIGQGVLKLVPRGGRGVIKGYNVEQPLLSESAPGNLFDSDRRCVALFRYKPERLWNLTVGATPKMTIKWKLDGSTKKGTLATQGGRGRISEGLKRDASVDLTISPLIEGAATPYWFEVQDLNHWRTEEGIEWDRAKILKEMKDYESGAMRQSQGDLKSRLLEDEEILPEDSRIRFSAKDAE